MKTETIHIIIIFFILGVLTFMWIDIESIKAAVGNECLYEDL